MLNINRLLPRVAPAVALVVALGIGLLPAPARSAPPPPAPSLRVLTSFLPVHSLALSVAGDRAIVENWLPQGVDPHEFQFSPRDLKRLREARLLVVAGLNLEGWTQKQLQTASGNPLLEIVEASGDLPPGVLVHDRSDHGHAHEAHESGPGHDHGGGPNPHFWLDPMLGAHAVTNLVRAFSAADPAHAGAYASNGARCVARLHALDAEYRQSLTPLRTNAFITFHDAFPYVARRYDLKLVGVVESSAAEDPSARELAALAAMVRREGVRVLFVDGAPTRLARRLAADLKLRMATLETLEIGKLGPTAYEDGLRRNLLALREALGAPAVSR